MKTISKFLILFFVIIQIVQASQINIKNLKCEYKRNPIGVDIEKPRFSWNMESNKRGINQTAYQILVASNL